MNANESSLEKLDRLMLRYRRQDIQRNQHYKALCERYHPLYQPFQSPANHHVIYVHQLTSIDILNDLIQQASETMFFTLDTQHQIETYPWAKNDIPSVIQIEFHSLNRTPLVLLIEVLFLTSKLTLRARSITREKKIQELSKQIFSSNKHIYTWGNPKKKLSSFYSYNLFTSHDLDQLYLHDLHEYFTQWYKIAYPHSTISRTRTKNQPYTLQTSIFLVFNEWLDTKMQYSLWNSGIDTNLKTYHRCFPSTMDKNYYRSIRNEIQYRQEMQIYAVNNCFAISKLMLHILQQWPLSSGKNIQISQVIHYKRKRTHRTPVKI